MFYIHIVPDQFDTSQSQLHGISVSIYGDFDATRTALWHTLVGDTTALGGPTTPKASYAFILEPRLWQQPVAGVDSNEDEYEWAGEPVPRLPLPGDASGSGLGRAAGFARIHSGPKCSAAVEVI